MNKEEKYLLAAWMLFVPFIVTYGGSFFYAMFIAPDRMMPDAPLWAIVLVLIGGIPTGLFFWEVYKTRGVPT